MLADAVAPVRRGRRLRVERLPADDGQQVGPGAGHDVQHRVPAAAGGDPAALAELVGEVEFAEFTPGGILRQARWRGLRPDKSPGEVVRES